MTVADPFSGTGTKKTVLVPGDVAMNVHLPDLGESFAVRRLSNGEMAGRSERGAVVLAPGDYVLMRNELASDKAVVSMAREANVPPYVAPEIPKGRAAPRLSVALPGQWRAGTDVPVLVESVFADEIWIDAKPADGGETRRFRYDGRTALPAAMFAAGAWDVAFAAKGRCGSVRFPDKGRLRLGLVDCPDDWNYLDAVRAAAAEPEGHAVSRELVADDGGCRAVRVSCDGFGEKEWSVLQFRCSQSDYETFFPSAPTGATVVVRARAVTPSTGSFDLVLVEPDLKSWRYHVPLSAEWRDVRLSASSGIYCGDWPWVPKLLPGVKPDVRRLACMRIEFGTSLYCDPASRKSFEVSSVRVE
ncbi:MAG: hypothetical protein IJH50_14080 [Kiritimatiellae bacterium]|nr:hypothetical protein [Kiritimatiellia bacterium]